MAITIVIMIMIAGISVSADKKIVHQDKLRKVIVRKQSLRIMDANNYAKKNPYKVLYLIFNPYVNHILFDVLSLPAMDIGER